MIALRHRGWLGAAVVTIAVLAAAAVYFGFGLESRPQFVEYPMQEPQDMPIGIAAAADGTVWFSIGGADAIGRVRDGQLERLPKPGKSVEPIGIAVAPDGSAWYTDIAAQVVSRMTTSGEVSSFRLNTPMVRLGRLAVAPDGAAWFAESSSQSITRLKEGELTRHGFQTPQGGPYGVAVAADGTVWATLQAGNQLLRIAAGRSDRGLEPAATGGSADRHRDRAGWRGLVHPVPRQQHRPAAGRRVRGVRGRVRRTPDLPGSRSRTTARSGSACCAPAASAGCATAR